MNVKLGELFESQITGEWGNECADGESGIKVLRTTNFTARGEIDYSKIVERNIKSEKVEKKRLHEGDIILEKSGGTDKTPVGRVVYCGPEIEEDVYLCNNFTQALRPEQAKACPRYLFHFMWYFHSSGKTNLLQNKTTGIRNLQVKAYMNMEIPLPPLDGQRKIAAVLDKIDSLTAKRRRQLEKLDELVKSRFIEMFGDININDKGWEAYPLGELCTIVRGGSPRPIEKYLGGDVPWIKIGDATDGESIYLHSTKEHIIQEGVSKSRMVRAGSLIFANCGVSLGFARIITFDGCIHDGWLAMEDINSRLDKIFLLQALNQMTEHFRKIAPAGTQPNLNTAIMKSYIQIVPPMRLQKEFIGFVQATDKSKLAVQQSLDALETLKKSLMQNWFG